jgi:hypothetical protein
VKPCSPALALAFSLLLASAPALAQDATAQAKTMFNAGAQAYEAGQFPAAIQAFGEAYRLAPRPGILFSMAQAHRKQYYVDRQPAHVREAVRLYREYVARVEAGGRRTDAAQALAELEPILEKLGAADAGAAAAPVERKAATRLMVSAQSREATITLDGGKPVEAPLIAEVKPGKHTVKVVAAGYLPEEREVQAAEGGIVALDIPLKEQPALLSVSTRDGADVAIDGRNAAATPLARPIEVTPGRHFIAVTRRGYHAFAEDVDFTRGETRTLTVHLEATGQSTAAYSLIGVGAAGLLAGGVLAAVAVVQQGKAQTLDDRRTQQGGLSLADLAQYTSYLDTRNEVRTAAGVTFTGAVLVGGIGVLLAIFDRPVVGTGARRDEAPKPAVPAPREHPMELSATPLLGPGLVGAAVHGRF